MSTETTEHTVRELTEKLRQSTLFKAYTAAFELATDLTLQLTPFGDNPSPCSAGMVQNGFCQAMRRNAQTCELCKVTDWQQKNPEHNYQPLSTRCFAGFRITRVPILMGERLVAYLCLAPVQEVADRDLYLESLAKTLRGLSLSKEERDQLVDTFNSLQAVDVNRYKAGVTLLSAFAIQLGELANRLIYEGPAAEPRIVANAKRYINENLDEKLTLDDVANQVNVSTFYFCKVFKQATGMSFTEYVNRRRVERAKKKLLDPDVRITEVAFDVGYQSLSQFNRSFVRYAGESPSRFRQKTRKPERELACA